MAANTDIEPARFRLFPDHGRDGQLLNVQVSFRLDGRCLASILSERYGHVLDAEVELPCEFSTADIAALVAQQSAYCAEGWHTSVNEPTEAAREAAEQWAEQVVRGHFPALIWNMDTAQGPHALRSVDAEERLLTLLSAPAARDRVPRAATHAALAEALRKQHIDYDETASGPGPEIVIHFPQRLTLFVHNPLGRDYGYDWQLLKSDGTQAGCGTWRLEADAVAAHLQTIRDRLTAPASGDDL